jgi:hypothetical protein
MAYTSVTVILNPAAGSGTHQSGVRRAAEARQLDVRELHAGDRAGALAWEAVEQGAQVLVAAGGDGTVSAVAGDVRTVNGGVFLDNVSVGFYAAMVGDPQYRERRLRVAMRYVQRPCCGVGDARHCAPQYLTGSRLLSKYWRFSCPTMPTPPASRPVRRCALVLTKADYGSTSWVCRARVARYRHGSCGEPAG